MKIGLELAWDLDDGRLTFWLRPDDRTRSALEEVVPSDVVIERFFLDVPADGTRVRLDC